MAIPRQCFSEDIFQLVMRQNVGQIDGVGDNMLADEMTIDLNVFSALMIDSVFSNSYGTCVASIQMSRTY